MSDTPPVRILQAILEEFLQAKPDQAICQGDRYILVDNRRKRRGDDMLKTGRKKEGRMEEDLKTDYQKGEDSRVPVELWDRRSRAYERERESGALNVELLPLCNPKHLTSNTRSSWSIELITFTSLFQL